MSLFLVYILGFSVTSLCLTFLFAPEVGALVQLQMRKLVKYANYSIDHTNSNTR